MRILIAGLGSIGRRHLACLQKIEGLEIAAYRTAKGTLKDQSGITEFYTMDDALAFNPDGVIIANPTSLHIDTATRFLDKGIRTFIEKPVSESSNTATALLPFEKDIIIGYSFRFSPCIRTFKQHVQSWAKPIWKVYFERGFYLPFWHPYADYRKEYTALKNLGGGVVRTLSHEIDLAHYLFGNSENWTGFAEKNSDLEIDTDDMALLTARFEKVKRVIFDLDFYRVLNTNKCLLISREGEVTMDYISQRIIHKNYEGEITEVFTGDLKHDVDTMYLEQMKDFVRFVKTGQSENCSLRDGIRVIQAIEQISN